MARVLAAAVLALALLAACGGSTEHDSNHGSPTGGTSSGTSAAGTATAGTPSGGSTSAGTHSGGAPGAGAAGSGSGEPTGTECDQDQDCKVVDDCCTCDVVPVGAKGQACAADCAQGQCHVRGYVEPKAVCVGHRCIFDVSCKSDEVICKRAKPTCPPGLVPGVVDSCWGPCVRPEQCSRLSDCTSCSADQVCVSDQNVGLSFRCVRVAPDCAAHPTCECTNGCFAQCSDTNGISCYCITC